MKTKRTFIPVFTLSVALLLTACNGKEAADTKKTQTTQTESGTEAVTICCGIRNRNGRGFRHKAGRFISAGEPDFFRSCGCMEQGVWHDE